MQVFNGKLINLTKAQVYHVNLNCNSKDLKRALSAFFKEEKERLNKIEKIEYESKGNKI